MITSDVGLLIYIHLYRFWHKYQSIYLYSIYEIVAYHSPRHVEGTHLINTREWMKNFTSMEKFLQILPEFPQSSFGVSCPNQRLSQHIIFKKFWTFRKIPNSFIKFPRYYLKFPWNSSSFLNIFLILRQNFITFS